MEMARMSNGGVRARFQILRGQVSGRRGVEMTPKSSAYVAAFLADIWNQKPPDTKETKYTLSCGFGNSNFGLLNSVCFEPYYVYPKLPACWIQFVLGLTLYIRNYTPIKFNVLSSVISISGPSSVLNLLLRAFHCLFETACVLLYS
jgi:hypothetical protein